MKDRKSGGKGIRMIEVDADRRNEIMREVGQNEVSPRTVDRVAKGRQVSVRAGHERVVASVNGDRGHRGGKSRGGV